MSDFAAMNLFPPILTALQHAGYTHPTPIQAVAIPHLLTGRDLLGIAQTGTGKTAAFALPILDRMGRDPVRPSPRHARVLILAPTRELVSQIDGSFATYGRNMRLSRAVVFGGVSHRPQMRSMERGVDILVATPGRLLDLMEQRVISLSQLEVFVLDEADRMLDMGFIHDIRKIIAHLPPVRQTLFFSATMPKEISFLADGILRDPVRVEVAPSATTVDRVSQKVYLVEKNNKSQLLRDILQEDTVEQVLVFTRTKHGANRLAEDLEWHGVAVSAIHGNKSQGAREQALKGFRDGRVRVLVATDIAARGLDVPGISHVINFDLPNEPESYVHRIGRTARAGREGMAISFCDSSERGFLREIERTIRCSVSVDATHPYHSTAAETAPPPLRGGGGGGGGRFQMRGGAAIGERTSRSAGRSPVQYWDSARGDDSASSSESRRSGGEANRPVAADASRRGSYTSGQGREDAARGGHGAPSVTPAANRPRSVVRPDDTNRGGTATVAARGRGFGAGTTTPASANRAPRRFTKSPS